MFGIVKALFLSAAFAGSQTSVHFISKPNIKNPSGRRAGGQRGAAFPDLGTFPGNVLSNFSLEKENLRPRPTAHPHEGCEAETAQSAPSGPRGDGFRPGVLPLPPHPPYPGSKYGSWTCSVRLQASPSAEPEERLAASDYIRTRGWRGRGSGPAGPGQRGSKKGPRTGWPAPALGREEVLPGPGVPEPSAPAPCARVTCSPSAAPGAGRAGSGCGCRRRARPSAGAQALLLESSN